jgi:arylsulfatase A
MKKELSLFTILGIGAVIPGITFCRDNPEVKSGIKKPNVILILADDLGYETLGCNGALSYKTPVLDKLASQGIRFTQCHANPLSSPSRLSLMTGQYNFRNYEYFGYLNPSYKTFANLMHDAGYATAIAGKWQLNGLPNKYPSALDPTTANHFGFDEYCLWQLTHTRQEGERYANPLLEKNGKVMEGLKDSYGPDVLVDFVNDFIDRNKDKPFFIYYSMVLTHDPFVATPDSRDWLTTEDRYVPDTAYFKDMVRYMDKNVGRIVDNLKDEGLWDNTVIIFTGDNGTNINIVTKTVFGDVRGGKGYTINTSTHVPLIVVWPSVIKKAGIYDGMIGFQDFFPTLADIASVDDCAYSPDGKSFMPVIEGKKEPVQDEIFIHYTPGWGNFPNDRWVFNSTYKLYRDGSFFNTEKDPLEQHRLTSLSPREQSLYNRFDKILNEKEKEFPFGWSNAYDKNPRPGIPYFGPKPAETGTDGARRIPTGSNSERAGE